MTVSPLLNLLIGSSVEPTGLDKYTGNIFKTFAEKPIMASTQDFRWNSGFFYNNFSLLNNSLAFQLAYTFNGDKTMVLKIMHWTKEEIS